jgi:hypothetical protein
MNEIKVYSSLLAALLVGSYFSYAAEQNPKPTASDDKVVVLDAAKDDLRGISIITRTQTVSVSYKQDTDNKSYPWFVVEQNKRKRSFAGNDKTDKALEAFAPFKALRSLGKLSATELNEAKLEKPERKLILSLKSADKIYDLGGRTTGARDHYLRTRGGSGEVFLIASAVLGDFEYPEGKFMERRLRASALKDVGKVMISANGKSKTILHKNRVSPNEAFWAWDAKPDEKSETLGNYVDKLDKLSALDYPPDDSPFPRAGTPVLIATWYGDDEKTVSATVEIWRAGEDKKAEYYAISNTTHIPVKLAKFSAEQIERDLATVMAE